MNISIPRLIDFQQIGDPLIGYISVAENFKNVPFEIKRVYWVYETPENVERGNHANYNSEHILISLKGSVSVFLENKSGTTFQFTLNDPNQGLYIPTLYWRKIKMDFDAICLSLSSSLFNENDYIRDYQEFLKLKS